VQVVFIDCHVLITKNSTQIDCSKTLTSPTSTEIQVIAVCCKGLNILAEVVRKLTSIHWPRLQSKTEGPIL